MKKRKSFIELLKYGAAGVTTTFVNLAVYYIFFMTGMDYRCANLAALILSKGYGYVVNKIFVFRSHCESKRELMIEISRFILARGFTGLIDYFSLIALVELLDTNKIFAKYLVQTAVIILNYVFGKFLVFRENNKKQKESQP